MVSISASAPIRRPSRNVPLILVALMLPALAAAEQGGTRYTGDGFASRSPVLGRHGMAATSHPIASSVAVDILKKGGSAADAAIAANAMLALVEPHMCGIGGDLFAIVWDPETRSLAGYNGSGRSPKGLGYAALREALGDAERIPLFGPLSVSVPGAVDGWYALHERYGRLPMAELLRPAIEYAREGIPVTEVDARLWADALGEFRNSGLPQEWFAELERVYTTAGRPPAEGEIFRNPDLADSYERLAQGGRESFYEGEMARRIVEAVARSGGHIEAGDLVAHEGEWVTPVSVRYRGYDVYELPPNSQGIAALQMLKILEAWPLAEMGRDNADFWHLLIEASKLAYEDRARYYADPSFGADDFEFLLSDEYATERRGLIDLARAALDVSAGGPPPKGDTTYLAVGDESGMMVSFIQSNFWEFGSGIVPDGLGFPLQNRGSQFTLEDGHANVYAPGKRPFHTIIPGFLMRGEVPLMAFGVMGGFLQPQAHVQVLVNVLDLGMNVQEAGDAARFVHSGSSQPTGARMSDGGRVLMEAGVADAVVEELERRGHRIDHGVRPYVGAVGGYQAVWRDPATGVYRGASEMRFDGAAAGY
ncbi:MAG: gamma-glutamyltransferase [Gammaproteobacteria bacterium]|nr:gamma-glutamyltransferase [Gammaproteobacteria bacterium]MDH4254088.1 gamma-glutamyltransferase [Gammaproteobacteria bacterium]MDH5309640.1 gamma-glutamyltransferase [Gammaproteobacteria bacterium]